MLYCYVWVESLFFWLFMFMLTLHTFNVMKLWQEKTIDKCCIENFKSVFSYPVWSNWLEINSPKNNLHFFIFVVFDMPAVLKLFISFQFIVYSIKVSVNLSNIKKESFFLLVNSKLWIRRKPIAVNKGFFLFVDSK